MPSASPTPPAPEEPLGSTPAATTIVGAVEQLERARRRTLDLLDSVSAELQQRQFTPILSPMVWDLAHIGNYEDIWLVQALTGDRVTPAGLDQLYDAFEQPRAGRAALPLLGPTEARAYISDVRARVLEALAAANVDQRFGAGDDPLLRDAFVLGLVLQHEHQHDETLLQARQQMGEGAMPLPGLHRRPARPRSDRAATTRSNWVRHSGGPVLIGTDDVAWAYDNERPAHVVQLAPFELARAPVTCGDWLAFIDDGGYDRAELWHRDGWAWRSAERVTAPMAWRRDGDRTWAVLRFGTWRELDVLEPVQHVSWWEADAFASWAGARLPSEHEWEAVARSHAGSDPSGNLGQISDGPLPIGALDGDESPGPIRLFGDVWEWTTSEFTGYPGFHPFPYREYSETHFDQGLRVLRGGSWATAPDAVRSTFRNWDLPIRRQLFCGLRLARTTQVDEPEHARNR